MGLSRNKVAVSEGAAGSPPFYGEQRAAEAGLNEVGKPDEKEKKVSLVVRFSGTEKIPGV